MVHQQHAPHAHIVTAAQRQDGVAIGGGSILALCHSAGRDPNGGHRHALTPGRNLARLSPEALRALRAQPQVAALMRRLGYE